jgi:hypothetical protein
MRQRKARAIAIAAAQQGERMRVLGYAGLALIAVLSLVLLLSGGGG